MSIHSISVTAPVGHVAASSTGTAGAVSAARVKPAAASDATTNPATPADKPAPLRFPWLSRLSTELAAATKTPTRFAAPEIGDNLDKQA